MCTQVINLMVQICNLYAGILKKFTNHTCWASWRLTFSEHFIKACKS